MTLREKRKEAAEKQQHDVMLLDKGFIELREELAAVKKEVTPNGKNTARLGDTVARTEQKVDNLIGYMERYAEKVDRIETKIERHLGAHEGIKE